MHISNNTKKKQYVIVAGAGISISPPSNLPSWWQYNKAIIDVIKELACGLCPEASDWIGAIDIENALPVQCISDLIVSQGAGASYFPLLELLNATSPNANHFALAELAKRGILKAVVTTNFDTLIENAFGQKAIELLTIVQNEEYYELSRVPTCKLFKIHGSVTDYDSLIDTVTQKAAGLSPAKRLVLSNIFLDSEIIVIGFSGADLDFDMDYIPISQVLETGGKVTWVLHPGSRPNANVIELKKKYPDHFQWCEKNLSDLFHSLGVDYNEINNGLLKTTPSDDYVMEGADAQMDRKIRGLFTAPHIGMHGCVGYCISLLNMMGLDSYASKLAEAYEKHIDLKSVDIFCVAGLRALVLQKMRDGEFEKSIQYSLAVIECLLYMDKLFKEARREKTGSDDMDEEQHQEMLMNLATSLSNLALVYFYMEDLNKARVHFEKAKEYSVEANDVRDLSVITFNLARVNYENDHDYDKFLESLKVSAEYAKNAGKLDTLAEILLEECKVRLEIGEYYLSHEILEEIACHLKNIGNFDLHIIAKQLRAKYFLRIGEGKKSLDCFKETVNLVKEKGNVYCAKILFVNAVKMYDQDSDFWSFMDVLCGMCGIDSHNLVNNLPSHSGHIEAGQISLPEFIIETLPADQWRKSIIICEYKKEKVYLPALFLKLCTEYTKRENWFRLRDEAKCYYNAAETEDDQSVALYYLGCADMESNDYTDAVEHFESVIRMGSKANQHYWAWANMELAKIKIQSRDINASILYYEAEKNALQLDSNVNGVVNACMSYVQHLFNEDCLEEAIACANHLLKDIKDTDLKKSIEEAIDIFEAVRWKKGKETDLDVKADPPEKIADEAIRLYDTGEDIAYAWELIRIAKEKYEKNGNMAGIGRCENNMANFNRKEGKTEEAAAHYEKAMYIKEKLVDIKGVINQLSNIISLYIEAPDSINIERFINYALLHMPEYDYYIEKYKLFFALFVYYILNEQYAEALHFAKLAHKGLDYFPEADMDPEVKKCLLILSMIWKVHSENRKNQRLKMTVLETKSWKQQECIRQRIFQTAVLYWTGCVGKYRRIILT